MKVGDLVRLVPRLRRVGEEDELWVVLWTKTTHRWDYKPEGRHTIKAINLTTKYLAEGITPEAFEVLSESR